METNRPPHQSPFTPYGYSAQNPATPTPTAAASRGFVVRTAIITAIVVAALSVVTTYTVFQWSGMLDGNATENPTSVLSEEIVANSPDDPLLVSPFEDSGFAEGEELGGESMAGRVYSRAEAGVVQVQHSRGQGSGFVIDRDGHIITNAHVVDGAEGAITVSFSNDERVEAELVGSDPATDIALLKVDLPASALMPLALGDSRDVRVGDPVVAIGNPLGFDRTVTTGIVSALSRQLTAPNGFTIPGAIQTDAAINQGNSGGPLFDDEGRVIGINSQIATRGQGNIGIGFAVPINLAKEVVADLMEDGKVDHAWLGVSGGDVDPTLARRVQLGVEAGAVIATVTPDSPAAKAGLRGSDGEITIDGRSYPIGGDVVIAVNGERIEDFLDLQMQIMSANPGDTLKLTVVDAEGERRELEVKLAPQPERAPSAGAPQGQLPEPGIPGLPQELFPELLP